MESRNFRITTEESQPAGGKRIAPVSTDYTHDFFTGGMTTINSLAFTAGSDAMQTYLSYANTSRKGIIENNSLSKHNLNVRETANFFNKKLIVDANINMLYQTGRNRPTTGGYYLNPLVGLYHFPIGGPDGEHTIDWYDENYAVPDPTRNIMIQNWYPGGLGTMEQSPYWLVRKTSGIDTRSRTIANLSFTFKFNNSLSLQARGNADFISDKFEKRLSPEGHNWWGDVNGSYMQSEGEELNLYGDLLLTYQKTSGDFALSATAGASVTDYTSNKSRVGSGGT